MVRICHQCQECIGLSVIFLNLYIPEGFAHKNDLGLAVPLRFEEYLVHLSLRLNTGSECLDCLCNTDFIS